MELYAYGLLLPGLRGMASAMFLRPELTNPIHSSRNSATMLAGVPDSTFSASLDWDIPWVTGLAAQWTRDLYVGLLSHQRQSPWRFSDWTRFDIGARYATVFNGTPVTIRANIENLFDDDTGSRPARS